MRATLKENSRNLHCCHSRFLIFPAILLVILVAGLLLIPGCSAAAAPPDPETMRDWISQMKTDRQGPFSRILWFCADGKKLPPEPYACVPHGGGVQHGELNTRAQTLRANGYFVANVLAGLDPETFLQQEDAANRFKQILIEKFLIRTDGGWILRKARFYRGALQEEDERAAARQLLLKMVQEPDWLDRNFLVLRSGARLLAHGDDRPTILEIRERTSDLSERDPAFIDIKNKIHAHPEASDAQLVRLYAQGLDDTLLVRDYESLADLVEQVYSPLTVTAQLELLAKKGRWHPLLYKVVTQGITQLQNASQAQRFAETARLMVKLREMLDGPYAPELRLVMLNTSLALEAAHFAAATELDSQRAVASRKIHIAWLGDAMRAAYGAGMLSQRQYLALEESLTRLVGNEMLADAYKRELDYLALVPGWAGRQLEFHFQEPVDRLTTIEPLTELFIQSQLRGGPLLFYSTVLDDLLRDANRLAGVQKTLFGREVGAGIRALNPGMAQGKLHLADAGQDIGLDAQGIYILPQTTSRLPPVAGIITAGEGNLLSHVQLLARNLGIPNVVVDSYLVEELSRAVGNHVLLAVSPGGSVQLDEVPTEIPTEIPAENTPADTAALTQTSSEAITIDADLNKLDLKRRELVRLADLRADDSGRLVGPKAAKLGELYHHYPEAVADGLVIPFGEFRALLEQPYLDSGMSMFEWMRIHYRRVEAMPEGSGEKTEASETLRRTIHDWILKAQPDTLFKARLRKAMAEVFGTDGSYGVFVRSDTNIEDLPGFSGAGLNLTVPNVVGFDEIFTAVRRVWASPFSQRAFAWRQGKMTKPEHVYPAVLLMRTVPVDKSGVMITRDIDTGNPDWLSVAVNEGIGGVVDGQSAESLRINRNSAEIRLMAQASIPWKRKPGSAGGIEKVPASGADTILQPAEIQQLLRLARDLPERFPAIVDSEGHATAADIEFGFLRGKLALFQIRPFLESRAARSNQYLKSLDANLDGDKALMVDLSAPPETKSGIKR